MKDLGEYHDEIGDGLVTIGLTESGENIDGGTIVVRDREGMPTAQEPLPDPRREQISETLSTEEQSDLKRLVGRFQKLQGAWYDGLEILWEIKSRRLYRQDHSSFEAFCRKVFGMGKSNINRSLRSAEVAKHLATNVAKPERESHIRPLLQLSDPAQQVDCYRQALEAATTEKRPMKSTDVAKAVHAVQNGGEPSLAYPIQQSVECQRNTVITRLQRLLLRDLVHRDVNALLAFEEALIRFQSEWFASHEAGVDAGNAIAPQDGVIVQEGGSGTDA